MRVLFRPHATQPMHFKLDRNLKRCSGNRCFDRKSICGFPTLLMIVRSMKNKISEVLDATRPILIQFIENVSGLTFNYYDQQRQMIWMRHPDLDLIKTVEIFLTVERRSGRERRPVRRTYSSRRLSAVIWDCDTSRNFCYFSGRNTSAKRPE